MSIEPFSGRAFKGAWGIFTFVLGLLFYYLAYFVFDQPDHEIQKEIFLKLGDVLIIGVVLGYLTTVTQNLGIFKKELESIIYSDSFVSTKSDLHTIWEKVSKQLFKSKFKHISANLLKLIKETYLPCEQISYYDDYIINIDLKWANKDKKLILVTSRLSFDLIAEEKNEIDFPLKSWINVEGLDKNDFHVKISDYLVNNKPAVVVEQTNKINLGIHEFSHVVKLKGELRYEISKTIEKKYSLEKDFVIAFKAQYIINKMTVRLTYPASDLVVDFYTRGAVEDYKATDKRDGFLEMKYKSILLPKQGYIIALKEIS